MRISVVIPTLNEAACIDRTIRHLFRHGGDALAEILVVDAGSTDDTAALAAAAGARVLQSTQRCRAVQMNSGADAATADVLYFVHADTLPPETYAADICAALSAGARMGNFRYRFDTGGALLRFNAYFTRFPWLVCQGGDKTFFIYRSLFYDLGGYDPAHVVMEEYDFVRRARKAGLRVRILATQCTVSARKYAQNSYLRVQAANFIVYHLWLFNLARPEKLRSLYRKMLR